jgi:hypothetical protein
LPVKDVRILGQATNQDGPYRDDYLFCFATGPERWYEASFYADGRDELLRALGTKLGVLLESGLCHSADFASQVLWPASLAGKPMFTYTDEPVTCVLGLQLRIPRKLQTFSEQVATVLARDG